MSKTYSYAGIPNRQPLLAHILHKEGLLDDEQMDHALRTWYAHRKEGPVLPFGQVVLELGYVTLAQLKPCVALQKALASAPGGAKPLGALLIESGYVRPTQLFEALREQKETGLRLGEVLVRLGYVNKPQMDLLLRRHGRKFTMRLPDLGSLTQLE